MSRPIVLVALLAGVGTTLVLSELRWFSPPAARRAPAALRAGWLEAPAPARGAVGRHPSREVVRPLATAVGDLVGQVFGVRDDLPTRLARIHSPLDAAALRVRQLGWAGGVFVTAAALVLLAGPPTVLGALAVVGAPLLAFLVIEQQVITASTPVATTAVPRAAGRERADRHAALGGVLPRRGAGAHQSSRQRGLRPGPPARRSAHPPGPCPRPKRSRSGRSSPTSLRSTGWWVCCRSTATRATSVASSPRRLGRSAGRCTASSSPRSTAGPSRSGSPSRWPPSCPELCSSPCRFLQAMRLFGS
jgi:hypothetical protein